MAGLPRRPRGRPSAETNARYQAEVEAFCALLEEIQLGQEFRVSARGWAYILEGKGVITKGDLDAAQALINACRKSGALPLDFCREDDGRQTVNAEKIDDEDAEEFAQDWVDYLQHAHEQYTPFSFWEDQDVYIEMTVEKVDLLSLFEPVCKRYRIQITNVSGWSDLNSRAAIMRRFAHWEAQGKKCVLLHCGDHDPGGLHISDFLRSNMADLAEAVGWWPDDLVIDRFGLNRDFIDANDLTWIDNLETSSGERLDDPEHHDHHKEYVQSYLREFGARKVEANALVVAPAAGRQLCRDAILRYVPANAVADYEAKIAQAREEAHEAILERLSAA